MHHLLMRKVISRILCRQSQHAMKQFDDALAAVAGVDNQAPGSPGRSQFPLSLFIDLQREYFKQVWHLWNAIFLQAFSGGAHASGTQAKADRRFKDKSWREQPYYDLLKQTYLLNSKRLHEFVDIGDGRYPGHWRRNQQGAESGRLQGGGELRRQ
jgi:polyhydroxyalkanoate synthase subunit PhaC